jgi:hypothetical protein
MKKWMGLLLAAALAGCGRSDDSAEAAGSVLAASDFEAVEGWMGDLATPSLTKEKAHSGTHSIAVRPGVDYGIGYSNALGKMSVSRPEKVKLTAWVFVPSAQVSTNLVVEVRDPGAAQALLWQGIDLKKEVKKFNEWQRLEKVIIIPNTAKPDAIFKMYLWHAGGEQPVYLDDVTLTAANDEK